MKINLKALTFFAAAATKAVEAKSEPFFPKMVRSAAIMSLETARGIVKR